MIVGECNDINIVDSGALNSYEFDETIFIGRELKEEEF